MSYKGEKNQAGFRLSIATLSARVSENGERLGDLASSQDVVKYNDNREIYLILKN